MQDELITVAKNTHPNIVDVHGWYEYETEDVSELHLVMERCECSLADKLREYEEKNQMMPRVEMLRILSNVASGLEHLHSLGMKKGGRRRGRCGSMRSVEFAGLSMSTCACVLAWRGTCDWNVWRCAFSAESSPGMGYWVRLCPPKDHPSAHYRCDSSCVEA